MRTGSLAAQVIGCDAKQIRALGERIRDEAERTARRDPRGLRALFRSLRQAADANPAFRPWALWIEGGTEHLRGRTAEATPLLDQASRIFRKSGDHHTAARVDLAGMDALACTGRHQAARQRGRRALEIFLQAQDNPRTVSALLNLGGLEEARDQLHKALELWLQAQRLVPEEDRLRRGLLATSLGAGYQVLGRFSKAEERYSEAITHLEAVDATATCLLPKLGLAEILVLRGNLGEALLQITDAEVAAEAITDENLLAEARLLRIRVELYLGHSERAAEAAAEMQHRCEGHGRPDDAARFLALRALAVADGAEGDLQELAETAECSLKNTIGVPAAAAFRVELALSPAQRVSARLARDAAILQRTGHNVAADLARTAAAEAALSAGDSAKARRLCRQVLAGRSLSVWPRVRALRLLSRIEESENPAAALKHIRQVISVVESVRGRLATEQDRAAFAAHAVEDYERLVLLLLARGDSRSRRQAFDAVARIQSRSLVEAIDRRRDLNWGKRPELAQRWNQLREELATMLAALDGRESGNGRYSEAAVEKRVRLVARELEDVEIEVARSSPALADALGRLPSLPLKSKFESGEVLLEVFFAGEDLVIFCLDDRGLRVEVAAGARRRCIHLIDEIRFQISKAAYGRRFLEAPGLILVRQVRARLAELGEMVLAPVARLPAPTRLWIAPHDDLHHVPMAALEINGDAILAQCPVAVVPSSAVLARLLSRPQRQPRRLAVAGAGSEHLPEIDNEVNEIAQKFTAAEVTKSACVADLQRLLENHDIVHVASHGAFQPLAPRGSGLLMTDGWFTTMDLLQTRLKVELITCAACASGDVQVLPGGEMVGVVRALLAGGVRTAMLAPGALDDRLAREAAGLFYERVFELGPGEAFREALLHLRMKHPHPALWASLQLYGDTRPWEADA
ncbi:MAG: CHAT domain-containing protein [Thermoanaerobaculales bacterium]|nr:CHAT domain-containing protein [Thermoanaerobaculales bacterium]